MERLNHSPGPWKLVNLPEASRIQIEAHSGHVVCEIHTYYKQRAPQANAHFISASPEMFRVLLRLSSMLDAGHIGDSLHKEMLDAIKKAKGKGV